MIILHLEHVHEPVEARSHIDRELHDDRFLSECLLERIQSAFPGSLVPVKLVHCQNHRHIVFVRIPCENLSADLYTLLCVGNEDCSVANPECRNGSAHEVISAWSVDNIELRVHKLCIKRSGIDGSLVDLFDFGIVGNRVLALNAAAPVNHFALIEHGFRQRGLTGPCATDKHHVTDVFSGISFHFRLLVIVV